jgi:hypothetical protein
VGALDEPWNIAFFSPPPGDGTPPAIKFLDEAPRKVRATMQAILEAVADAPPPRFGGGLQWQAMHGDMGGIYEARVKGPDKRLYRMFCLLERSAPGLAAPTLICLTGLSKPVGTAFTDSEYRKVRRLRDTHESLSPRSVVS